MTAPDLDRAVWRKSRRSGDHGGECVELAALWRPERAIGLRDSKNPTGPVLAFTPSEWNAFVARVKTGTVDD